MAHYCICPKCGQKFDRDKIQAVQVAARRYGHATCYPDNDKFIPLGPEADPDLVKLKEYITNKYGDKANWPVINKQIKDFQKKGYSLSGILKSLIYFYEVKSNSVDKSNGGIGIVEYVYQDAYNYYYSLFMTQEANKNKNLITKVKEIIIKPPVPAIKKKLFNLGEDE